MQILIRRDNFSTASYALHIGESVLAFVGGTDSFSLPYSEMEDFSVTEDRRGKAYFTLFGANGLLEGQFADTRELSTFVTKLKEKMNGTIQIEVRK